MIKLQSVPADITSAQMQISWHKPRPDEIKAASVLNILFSKAKQSDVKREPVLCSLFETHAKYLQELNSEQQLCLEEGLLNDHSTCAFASILPTNSPTQYLITPLAMF